MVKVTLVVHRGAWASEFDVEMPEAPAIGDAVSFLEGYGLVRVHERTWTAPDAVRELCW